MFQHCQNLSTVTMSALESEIKSKTDYFSGWLDDAGTEANSLILKVQDETAYSALEGTSYLPAIWKKDAANTTVLNKDNGEIE